jgi:hypothetical protein
MAVEEIGAARQSWGWDPYMPVGPSRRACQVAPSRAGQVAGRRSTAAAGVEVRPFESSSLPTRLLTKTFIGVVDELS